MKRREFITLLGSAAAVPWVLGAHAQQPPRMRRIGVLDTLAADDPEASVRHGAFMQGLQELGWGIGRNLRIDTRWAAGDTGRIRSLAAEMVALGPDVIFTSGFSTIRPLLDATSTIPIVFANVVDPVGAGFVASLSAARRYRHRVRQLRVRLPHQVAGAAQADRARRHARRRAARSHDLRRYRPVRGHSGRGAIFRCGSDADRCSGWRGIARCRRGIRAGAE